LQRLKAFCPKFSRKTVWLVLIIWSAEKYSKRIKYPQAGNPVGGGEKIIQ
jgi:hypothetical protein